MPTDWLQDLSTLGRMSIQDPPLNFPFQDSFAGEVWNGWRREAVAVNLFSPSLPPRFPPTRCLPLWPSHLPLLQCYPGVPPPNNNQQRANKLKIYFQTRVILKYMPHTSSNGEALTSLGSSSFFESLYWLISALIPCHRILPSELRPSYDNGK